MNAPEDTLGYVSQGSGGLLAVHAHPDDETLSSGALLSAWAASGASVTLVTCTRGEQGEVIGEGLAHLEGDGPALAAHRELELAAALRALGITQHYFLDQLVNGGPLAGDDGLSGRAQTPASASVRIEDSGMAWAPGQTSGTAIASDESGANAFTSVPLDVAAGPLAQLITETTPAVVVTYDPRGGYGHPDHVRAHEVTMRAVELASRQGAAVPVVLWPSTPTADLRAAWTELGEASWARKLSAANLALPDPGADLPPVASDERLIVLEVDVARVLDRVVGAMNAHATQIHAVTRAPQSLSPRSSVFPASVLGAYALSNDVLGTINARETYALAPVSAQGDVDALVLPRGVRAGSVRP